MASYSLDARRAAVNRQQLSQFMSWSMGNDNHPATNNRYSVSFSTPNILRSGRYLLKGFQLDVGDYNKALNYYANSVNLPSKQIATGTITNIGSAYNYATSATVSQISIQFIMPRSHNLRLMFERWMSIMSSDANQFTDYYDDYVCPHLWIYKWERGGGPEFTLPESFKAMLKKQGIDEKNIKRFRDDQLVGAYDIRNVFPSNIGAMTLTNEQAGLLTFDVTFLYERYRFYAQGKLDDDGFGYRYDTTASTAATGNSKPQVSASQQSSASTANATFGNAQFSVDKTGLQGPNYPF